jgi:hypothetical protein
MELTKADHIAMCKSIEWVRTHSKDDVELIEHVLECEGFAKAGEYAANIAQSKTLGLKCWECAPCNIWGHDDQSSAIELRDRLLSVGISLFEPDPMQALAEAEQQRVAT